MEIPQHEQWRFTPDEIAGLVRIGIRVEQPTKTPDDCYLDEARRSIREHASKCSAVTIIPDID